MSTLQDALERRSWDPRAKALAKYVRSIRHPEKRSYAVSVSAWRLGMAQEPDRKCYSLTTMGAQAVELATAQILREVAP